MRTGQPSRTAIVVAKSLALTGASPETGALVAPASLAFARRSLVRAGCGRFVTRLDHRWGRRLIRMHESLMIPGLALHHSLRKLAIEEIVTRRLIGGATRVVQIGAGFDSMAYRLHREFPMVRFVEIDHPATQDLKASVIDSLAGAAAKLELLPLDLTGPERSSWAGVLDPEEPGVVIIEGMLMYLEPGEVGTLIRRVGERLSPASRLVFTFMTDPAFRCQSPAVRWWLQRAGEPFRWWQPARMMDQFLWEAGLKRCEIRSTRQIAGSVAPGDSWRDRPPAIAEGELICESRPLIANPRERGGTTDLRGNDHDARPLGLDPVLPPVMCI